MLRLEKTRHRDEEPYSGLLVLFRESGLSEQRSGLIRRHDVSFELVQPKCLDGKPFGLIQTIADAQDLGKDEQCFGVTIERVGSTDQLQRLASEPLRLFDCPASRQELGLNGLQEQLRIKILFSGRVLSNVCPGLRFINSSLGAEDGCELRRARRQNRSLVQLLKELTSCAKSLLSLLWIARIHLDRTKHLPTCVGCHGGQAEVFVGAPGSGDQSAGSFETSTHGLEAAHPHEDVRLACTVPLMLPEERLAPYAYVAPLAEVETICGGNAFGCYGGNHLVVMGETNFDVTPESVARHEYGHHIAAHRSNAPWLALDWGTKRWATYVGVCSRAAAGMAFPGDEGVNYPLNPGEAFAESYRVLMETAGSAAGFDWPIVDPSFLPGTQALTALREDVLHPWESSTTTMIRGKFLRRSRTWNGQVATPLDGDLRVQVSVPGGGADDVTLLSSDGRTVLAAGSWTGSGAKVAEYRVCGTRSVKVRVKRGGPAARFSLRVTAP